MPDFTFPVHRHIVHDYYGGDQWLFKFSNGYGASVIRHRGSYGFDQGLFEVGLIEWNNDEFELIYNDDFVDVRGYQSNADINAVLTLIASYSV